MSVYEQILNSIVFRIEKDLVVVNDVHTLVKFLFKNFKRGLHGFFFFLLFTINLTRSMS